MWKPFFWKVFSSRNPLKKYDHYSSSTVLNFLGDWLRKLESVRVKYCLVNVIVLTLLPIGYLIFIIRLKFEITWNNYCENIFVNEVSIKPQFIYHSQIKITNFINSNYFAILLHILSHICLFSVQLFDLIQ